MPGEYRILPRAPRAPLPCIEMQNGLSIIDITTPNAPPSNYRFSTKKKCMAP